MNQEYRPLVTVIITCYNKARYIPDAIQSVLNQTYSNIECILIDDGSTDNSGDIVRKYRDNDNRLRYFLKKKEGAGSARNFGVEKSQGKWIQFLDGDDYLSIDKIEKTMEYVDKLSYDEDVVFYSDYKIIRENQPGFEKEFRFKQLNTEQLIKELIGRKFGLDAPTPLHVNNTFHKREIFKKINFDESLTCFEDYLFFYRQLSTGVQFIHTPCIGMTYRSNPEGISKVPDDLYVGYVQFLENLFAYNINHFEQVININDLIKYFAKRKKTKLFRKTMDLVRRSNVPVYSSQGDNIRDRLLFLNQIRILYRLLRHGKRLHLEYPNL